MRGLVEPAGIITSPGVHGCAAALDERPAFDVETAKALIAEAGYADGFETTLHCPNDRYVNDEPICQVVVDRLPQIGIEANLVAPDKSIHFAELLSRDYDFYTLGAAVPRLGGHDVFNILYPTEGSWTFTGLSDERLDEPTVAMEGTVDLAERAALIDEAWEIAKEGNVYLPLHHQVITWAMVDGLDMPIEAQDSPPVAWARMSEWSRRLDLVAERPVGRYRRASLPRTLATLGGYRHPWRRTPFFSLANPIRYLLPAPDYCMIQMLVVVSTGADQLSSLSR